MATTETLKKVVATAMLENGTDESGNMKYVSQSFGTLAKDSWDGDKLLNIKDALAPCLSKTIGYVTSTKTSELTRSS